LSGYAFATSRLRAFAFRNNHSDDMAIR
jgi:hypothetical protein